MKFYPPSKIVQAKEVISHFRQKNGETITEASERYGMLLMACPQHGFSEEQTIMYFYNGLMNIDRSFLNTCAKGSIWSKTVGQMNENIPSK